MKTRFKMANESKAVASSKRDKDECRGIFVSATIKQISRRGLCSLRSVVRRKRIRFGASKVPDKLRPDKPSIHYQIA
ncbi:MAG: hypothetical protein MN733_01020 [Nitrososphaera sp.]|nr:hypothetical protein [Nitrososphaera sp.]